jgi:multidrug efflux pump subunit AcrB
VAIFTSLAVAFIVTPYLAFRLLKGHVHTSLKVHGAAHEERDAGLRAASTRASLRRSWIGPRRGEPSTGVSSQLLFVSVGLVLMKAVKVKMLPFDNKSEFQVVMDLPEGTTLETTNALGQEIARYLRTVPEVKSTEVYAGTAAPFNFNGLVRHYFMRSSPNAGDVQVNLVSKDERSRQSHAIAVAVRPGIDSIAARYGAAVKVAEIPPGPPVLSTIVAEVYGADDSTRLAAAAQVKQAFEVDAGRSRCRTGRWKRRSNVA